MRMTMTALDFRRNIDGFGLAIMILGYVLCGAPLVLSVMAMLGVRTSIPSLAFEGLVLIALGGGLRLLVRIDKRLEAQARGSTTD